MKHIKLFENFDLKEYDKRMKQGFKLSPEDIEYGVNAKGTTLTRNKNRPYDEDITKQVDKSFFVKNSNEIQYEVGDIVRVRSGYEIKNVTITDKEENLYRNVAGGNAFVPHSFKYIFVEN
jgi:hypothetical protein